MEITRAFQLIPSIKINKYLLFFLGVGAVIISLPNPLFSFPPGIFVSFIPLFILSQKTSGWRLLLLNFLFLWIVSLGMLIPLDLGSVLIDLPALLCLILIFMIVSLIIATFLTLAVFLSKKYGREYSPLFWGANWVVVQFMLSYLPFVFPFPIETALVPLPIFIQSAGVLGSYFMGFLIIATNSLLADLLATKKVPRQKIVFSLIIGLQIINLVYGVYALNLKPNFADPGVALAIIQPNLGAREHAWVGRSKLLENRLNRKMLYLSKEALKKEAKLIIWPEASGNYALQNDLYLEKLHREITAKGAELLIGTPFIDYTRDRKIFNIAFILKGDGDTTQPYEKERLFPFSESSTYSNGNEFQILPSESGLNQIGAMICLESTYPWIARKLTKAGARALVLLSSDAAFGNSMIPYLHKNLMALRAIENNRFSMHVGTTGPSAIFDNKGRNILEIPYGRTAYGNAIIHRVREKSMYNKLGDWVIF